MLGASILSILYCTLKPAYKFLFDNFYHFPFEKLKAANVHCQIDQIQTIFYFSTGTYLVHVPYICTYRSGITYTKKHQSLHYNSLNYHN
jgi:hypothetical protein